MMLVDNMPDDIYKELVLLQGISAQVTRIKRRRRSLMLTQRMFESAAAPEQPRIAGPTDAPTAKLSWVSASGSLLPSRMSTPTQEPLGLWRSSQPAQRLPRTVAKRTASTPIPLKHLLPGSNTRPASSYRGAKVHHQQGLATMLATPPDSPTIAKANRSSRASINPRFSDARFEYIGRDCVIHNGVQTVDIALEFAAQRAAPRLVSFPRLPESR